MSEQKEQDGVLLEEYGDIIQDYYGDSREPELAAQLLAKAREAVKGAELKLNRGGILSDVEVTYYNNGAEAQTQATLKVLGGE